MVKKSIQYMSAVLWNKPGNEMRMNSSLDNFKRLIKKLPPEFYVGRIFNLLFYLYLVFVAFT